MTKDLYADFNASTDDWIKDDGSIFRFSNDPNPDIITSDITLRPSWRYKYENDHKTQNPSNPDNPEYGPNNPDYNPGDTSWKGDGSSGDGQGESEGNEGDGEIYVPKTYKVSFECGVGGEGTMEDVYFNEYESFPMPSHNFSIKSGYSFVGWKKKGGDETIYNEYSYLTANELDGDVTFVAQWVKGIVITFSANGGEGAMDYIQVNEGEKVTLPPNRFSKLYSQFIGWGRGEEGDAVDYQDRETITAESCNITLYAKWKMLPYSPSFCLYPEGQGWKKWEKEASGLEGENVTLPQFDKGQSPYGYTFLGWTDDSSANKYDSQSVKYQDGGQWTVVLGGNLYAVWEARAFYVSFDAGGGVGEKAGEYVKYNSNFSLPANPFTKSGSFFKGWEPSDRTYLYLPGQSFGVRENITFTAVWGEKPVITFSANDGSGKTDAFEYTIGDVLTFPSLSSQQSQLPNLSFSLQREHYTFCGFAISKLATKNEVIQTQTYTVSQSVTFYAIWEGEECTISFDTNGGTGSVPKSIKGRYGEVASLPSANTVGLSKSHYTFAGWGKNKTDKLALGGYTFQGNKTLFALWKGEECTVYFNLNGASGTMPNIECNYGDEIECWKGTNGTKPHCTFDGWMAVGGEKVKNHKYKVEGGYSTTYTLYAIWKPIQYKINLDSNGKGEAVSGVASYLSGTFGQKITLPTYSASSIPYTDPHYKITGWKDSNTINAKMVTNPYEVTNYATLYAVWEANTYTITFDANGGNGTNAITKKYGESITLPNSTKQGYIFLGWATDKNAGIAEYTSGTSYKVNDNKTLYAVWGANSYTITFDANGGEGTIDSINTSSGKSITFSTNKNASGNDILSRTGYTLLGWATDKNATTAQYTSGVSYSVTSNKTFYAVWKANTYTITLDNNDGTGTKNTMQVEYGRIITPSRPSSREHYEYFGWADIPNVDLTDPMTLPYPDSYTVVGDATIYVVWRPYTYRISFDNNGGNGIQSAIDGRYSESITLPNPRFGKTGYNFAGWATDKNAGVAQYTSGNTYTVDGNKTLYAVWVIKSYTINFDANGGSGTQNAITKNYGESVSLPQTTTFTKTGYTFKGWVASQTNTTLATSYTTDSDTTFYAVWGVNSYTISFYESATSTTPLFSVQKEYGDVLTEDDLKTIILQQSSPASPTPTNEYRFFGWSESQASDGSDIISKALGNQLTITNTISLYAHWLHIECYDAYVHISSGKNNDVYLGKYFQDNPYTTVVIPSNIISIGISNDGSKDYLYPFKDCTTVKNIFIADGTQYIDSGAFKDCTSLETVSISDSVTGMGINVFSGCSSLKNIKFSSNFTTIPANTFKDCTSLSSIEIPNTITDIQNGAFSGCTSLSSIEIPNNVTSLGNRQEVAYRNNGIFYGCTSLSNITLPNSITSLSAGIFCGCTSLSNITLPDSITSIAACAFDSCTSLVSITIPNSVTSIGQWAFLNCRSILSITIPSSVVTVGDRACGSWVSSQTINVWWQENQKPDGWDENWNANCTAKINYGGSQ